MHLLACLYDAATCGIATMPIMALLQSGSLQLCNILSAANPIHISILNSF
jgi:hypothetical protein